MKTRAEIYGQEAMELLRIISMYPGLALNQLCRFFPGKETRVVANLLAHLERQGRIVRDSSSCYFSYGAEKNGTDRGLRLAVWVLLDFLEQAEYHAPGDFPAKLLFFARSELYEIVWVADGQEVLVNHVLGQNSRTDCRRIVLVEEPGQIERLHIPGASGYCTVTEDGQIHYYKKQFRTAEKTV